MNNKKNYAVFGLGRYGSAVAKELCANGAEVLAVDINGELVNNVTIVEKILSYQQVVINNVDEIQIEKDEKQFIHDDIINQIVEIGQWLGFESKSEVKIADGAIVDAIWQAQIGNMGKVIYAFEVQTHGSIDSLILNLQKATNNFAVQAIVAVSDEIQIEKIKRESKGIRDIESKLKTWNYIEVIEMHDCLERSNEIINNLGLVPDSFI